MSWRIAPGSLESPLIIAHRGDSSTFPENTIESFRRAVDIGADGIELDVRLTRDGQVAVFHDRRVDRTTTGTGVVGSFTMSELKTLDAGSWFGPEFEAIRVPTLDEVFDELPPSFLINVEMKVRGLGFRPLASRVVAAIRRHDRFESTLVASFHPLALWVARVMEPRIARGFIWADHHPLPLRARWFSFLADAHWVDPDKSTFSPELLERYHRRGKPVLAWDLDVGTDLERLAKMGLDAVVTDYPAVFTRQKL